MKASIDTLKDVPKSSLTKEQKLIQNVNNRCLLLYFQGRVEKAFDLLRLNKTLLNKILAQDQVEDLQSSQNLGEESAIIESQQSSRFTLYLNYLLIRWRESKIYDHQLADLLIKFEENESLFNKVKGLESDNNQSTAFIDELLSHLPEIQSYQNSDVNKENDHRDLDQKQKQEQGDGSSNRTEEEREVLRLQRQREIRKIQLSQIFCYRQNLFNQRIYLENETKYLMVSKNEQHLLFLNESSFLIYPLNNKRTQIEIGCLEYNFYDFKDKKSRGRNLVLLDLDDKLQGDNLLQNQDYLELDQETDNIIEKEKPGNKGTTIEQNNEMTSNNEENLSRDRNSFQNQSPRRIDQESRFKLGEILFADIHDSQNYILVYQKEKDLYSNLQRDVLYIFDLKDKSQLQFQKWDLNEILQKQVDKEEMITQLSFHEDYGDFQIINVKTDRLQNLTVDLKNDFIFDVQKLPCSIDLSIFRKPNLYLSYFDQLKQFIYDQTLIGNEVVLPYRDSKIAAGYDFQKQFFFIYDIRSNRITRKFQLYDDTGLLKQVSSDSSNEVVGTEHLNLSRQQIKLKKEDIKFLQISDEGNIITFIANRYLHIINLRLSEEIESLLTPTKLVNFIDCQQKNIIQTEETKELQSDLKQSRLKQQENLKTASDWINQLESKYQETQSKNITQHQREDLMKGLQLEVQECLGYPKELFRSEVALRAVRDFQNTCSGAVKEEYRNLKLMGYLENLHFGNLEDKIENFLLSSNPENTYAFIHYKRMLYCYRFQNPVRDESQKLPPLLLFQVPLPRMDEMHLIEKESILVVKDQDNVTFYAIQELIRRFQLSPQFNRVNSHYNKLISLHGSLVGQLHHQQSIGDAVTGQIAAMKLPAQLKMISRVKNAGGVGTEEDIFAGDEAENENNFSESDAASQSNLNGNEETVFQMGSGNIKVTFENVDQTQEERRVTTNAGEEQGKTQSSAEKNKPGIQVMNEKQNDDKESKNKKRKGKDKDKKRSRKGKDSESTQQEVIQQKSQEAPAVMIPPPKAIIGETIMKIVFISYLNIFVQTSDEKIIKMICSRTCTDLAFVTLLTRSKIIIYSLTTEEDDMEEDEGITLKSSIQVQDKLKSKIVVSKSEFYRLNYIDFELQNFGHIIDMDFDFKGEKFVTLTSTGLLSLWESKKEVIFARTFAQELHQVQHLKFLDLQQKVIAITSKPALVIYNTDSEHQEQISFSAELYGRKCHKLYVDKSETFAFALFTANFSTRQNLAGQKTKILVFNLKKLELVESPDSSSPSLQMLTSFDQICSRLGSNLPNHLFIDENCTYAGLLDERRRQVELYLMDYKFFIKKIEKPPAPVVVYEPPKIDPNEHLVKHHKTSCCSIF